MLIPIISEDTGMWISHVIGGSVIGTVSTFGGFKKILFELFLAKVFYVHSFTNQPLLIMKYNSLLSHLNLLTRQC